MDSCTSFATKLNPDANFVVLLLLVLVLQRGFTLGQQSMQTGQNFCPFYRRFFLG